jgi:hypothetical protein
MLCSLNGFLTPLKFSLIESIFSAGKMLFEPFFKEKYYKDGFLKEQDAKKTVTPQFFLFLLLMPLLLKNIQCSFV